MPERNPTWRCDCETIHCSHKPGACRDTGANVVLVFGIKQSLCDACLSVAKQHFPNEVEEGVSA